MTLVQEPTGEVPRIDSTFYDFDLNLNRQDLGDKESKLFDQFASVDLTEPKSQDPEYESELSIPLKTKILGIGGRTIVPVGNVGYLSEPKAPRPKRAHSRAKNRTLFERAKRYVVGGTVATISAVALFGYFSSKEVEHADVTQAEVTYVGPSTIAQRAIVESCIGATVFKSYSEGASIAWAVLTSPWVAAVIDDAHSESSSFTGPNGKGCGMVETLVGANELGVKTKVDANGHETITIPGNDIEFTTLTMPNRWLATYDEGVTHSFIKSFAKLTPFTSFKNSEKLSEAQLESATIDTALDTASKQCGEDAWHLTTQAINAGYQLIEQSKIADERAAGLDVKPYSPSDLTVKIQGTPSFPEAAPIPDSQNYSVDHVSRCTVDANALHLTEAKPSKNTNFTNHK